MLLFVAQDVVETHRTHLPGKTCSLCVGRYLFSVSLCVLGEKRYIGQFAIKSIEIRKACQDVFDLFSIIKKTRD